MAKRLSSVVGIDIGSQSVKVAEVRLQGRQPVVTAVGSAPTPSGTVDHVGLHDPEAVSVALKQACAEAGVSVQDAVASLAGQGSVLVRTLEVPNMSESELKQHMEWEFTRNIPFAESTVETAFSAYPPETPGSQNIDVVMAISTRSSVDNLVAALKRAGRKASALDVEPLGLLRSLAISYEGSLAGKHVCVVEIGHKTSSINIYRDEKLLMPRQVPLGGEAFTRALADGLGVSFEDAERIKVSEVELPSTAVAQAAPSFGAPTVQSYNPFADSSDSPSAPVPAVGAAGEEPDRYYGALAGALDEFVAEVRRSVDYFRSKGGDVDIVLLAGGGAKLRNLDQFLGSALGITVEAFDPLRNVSLNLKRGDVSALQANKQEFAVAIGNGLHIAF